MTHLFLLNCNVLFAVSASVKARKVIIKGPRGTLTRTFRHLAVDITMVGKSTVMVEKWFGKHKELAVVRTVCSHIENMIKGVTKVSNIKASIELVWASRNCLSLK